MSDIDRKKQQQQQQQLSPIAKAKQEGSNPSFYHSATSKFPIKRSAVRGGGGGGTISAGISSSSKQRKTQREESTGDGDAYNRDYMDENEDSDDSLGSEINVHDLWYKKKNAFH